jgi:hypothetical protein
VNYKEGEWGKMDVTKKSCFGGKLHQNTYHHPLWDLPFGKWEAFKFPWV